MDNRFDPNDRNFGAAQQQQPRFEFNWAPVNGDGRQQRPADPVVPVEPPVYRPIQPIQPPTYRPVQPFSWGTPITTHEFLTANGNQIIPTLRPNEKANEQDRTEYKPTDEAAQVYNKVRDSVVRIHNVLSTTPEKEQAELGTGFFISKDGKVATAYHVVEDNGGKQLRVDLPDGRSLPAHVVDSKPLSDIAILQVDNALPGEKFKPIELADTARSVTPEQSVYVVGHPDGWASTFLSPGQVLSRTMFQESGLAVKDPTPNPLRPLVLANIHVDQGNSGSPIVNSEGKAIGVVSFGNSANVGLADTVDDLHSLLGDAPRNSYYPSELKFGPVAQRDAFDVAASGIGLLAARSTRGVGRFGGALAMGSNAWDGYKDLTNYDLGAFGVAWDKGSTAEKFSTTLNLGADAGMVGSAVFYLLGGAKVRTAASIVMGTAAAAKMFNAAGSDRTY